MKDLLLDDNYQLQIVNGDLVLDTSDAQNQQLIIKADKGNFLQYPTIGVRIDQYLNGDLQQYLVKLKKDIQLNFQLDNYTLLELTLDDNGINFKGTTR